MDDVYLDEKLKEVIERIEMTDYSKFKDYEIDASWVWKDLKELKKLVREAYLQYHNFGSADAKLIKEIYNLLWRIEDRGKFLEDRYQTLDEEMRTYREAIKDIVSSIKRRK